MGSNLLTLDEYRDAFNRVTAMFHIGARLPEQIFNKRYAHYLLCDFDYVMDRHFVDFLRKSRLNAGSKQILLSVLDPDPIEYFHKHFNKINSFYFDPDAIDEEYADLLCRDPGNWPDAIFYFSEVVTWIPESASWAIWGERSREIGVIGLDDPAIARYLVEENGNWTDAKTALDGFACLPYPDQQVPDDFRRALIANYGSREDLES